MRMIYIEKINISKNALLEELHELKHILNIPLIGFLPLP